MTITFAVDRLYTTGWLPGEEMDLLRLPNGLRYPTIRQVLKDFHTAGAILTIKSNLIFECYRAEWKSDSADAIEGTVIAACEAEAAVFALAKFREQQRLETDGFEIAGARSRE